MFGVVVVALCGCPRVTFAFFIALVCFISSIDVAVLSFDGLVLVDAFVVGMFGVGVVAAGCGGVFGVLVGVVLFVVLLLFEWCFCCSCCFCFVLRLW